MALPQMAGGGGDEAQRITKLPDCTGHVWPSRAAAVAGVEVQRVERDASHGTTPSGRERPVPARATSWKCLDCAVVEGQRVERDGGSDPARMVTRLQGAPSNAEVAVGGASASHGWMGGATDPVCERPVTARATCRSSIDLSAVKRDTT
eukprot:4032741-Prymnesium_polylepis.1